MLGFSSVLILVYFCGVSHGSNDPSALGYQYDPEISGWLKLNKSLVDWVGARDSCRKEGGFLASAWTTEVASPISRLQNENSILRLYSGVRQIQVIYTEGGSNGPTGLCAALTKPIRWVRTELCEVFYSNGSTGYLDCKHRLPFICFSPETHTTPTPAPISGRNSLGYEYSYETRRCYKFHIEVTSWSNANSTCIKEGAQLAVPNSDTEARVLTSIHDRHPDIEINGTSWPDWSNVGIYWESGTWRTVDGTTLGEAGYELWRSGWPTHMETYPYVCMHRNGDYTNTSNRVKYPFICEKAPLL